MKDARTQFVLDMHKKNFTPTEILVLLKKNNFKPMVRSRIYQILKENE